MEIYDLLTSLVNSVGFPICVCYFMYTYINKMTDKYDENLDNLTEVLHKNTIALEKIFLALEGEKNESE